MQTNNKLREAVELAKSTFETLIQFKGDEGFVKTWAELGRDAMIAALSAPPRNCDVYTSDELKVKFKSELASELPIANEHEKNLVAITAMGVIDTLFATATEKEGGGR